MDYREISLFKNFSDSSINKISEEAEILKFRPGQPMSFNAYIQNKVYLLLDGVGRLTSKTAPTTTIAKLGKGSFVGLASMLRAESCEEVFASENAIALSLSDELIINLYKEEINFRNFCQDTLFPGEILNLTERLIEASQRTDVQIISAFNLIYKSARLQIIDNNSKHNLEKNKKYFIASANIKNRKIGDIYNNGIQLEVKPPFIGRLIELPLDTYNEFNRNTPKYENQKNENENNNLKEVDTFAPLASAKSSYDFGQYTNIKERKLIRADGDVRITIACLQMISEELELPFRRDSIEKIIRDDISRGNKPSAQLLGGLLSMLGIHVSSIKAKNSQLTRIPTPSIIAWKDSFAMLRESNANGIKIASPKDGNVILNLDEITDNFNEDVEILLVERNNRTPNKRFGLDWFVPSLKKYQGVLIQVLIASFVVQLFTLANPLLLQIVIDKVISQRSLDTLQVLGVAILAVTIIGGLMSSLRTFLFAETTNRIDTRLGSEVIDHLLRVPLNYFDKRPVGELASRISELERIREFLTGQALTTILDAAFSVIYIFVMFAYSWLLSIVALAVVPIQILLTFIGAPLLRRQIRDIAVENAKTQSHLVEVLTGIQTVKAQNVETVSRWKWQNLYKNYISSTFQRIITGTALSQTSDVLQKLSQLMVLWIGASLVLAGKLSLGQLIAFRIISGYVTQPLLRLSNIWTSIQELKVSFERLADIIDTPEESDESDKSNITLPQINGDVTFKDVSFSFKEGSPDVISTINLQIPKGQFVGIAGQSGSGKSTLMKLLPRLYDINRGKILIDNYDISKVELYSLRKQIGIVPQDPLLFAGSVSENIALTNPDLDSDEIVKAAKAADAHDFIMNLPMGYSTNVGERGSALSGGQKQRIAIARTLVSKPRLLIMDEATSALDYETEKRVCDNLRDACVGSTVFFITHRLSTIRNADKIILMHSGVISEIGTHDELMNEKSRYYALYMQQGDS